jgi:hypothetical protein
LRQRPRPPETATTSKKRLQYPILQEKIRNIDHVQTNNPQILLRSRRRINRNNLRLEVKHLQQPRRILRRAGRVVRQVRVQVLHAPESGGAPAAADALARVQVPLLVPLQRPFVGEGFGARVDAAFERSGFRCGA